MHSRLSLLNLFETGNTERLTGKASSAGFHDPLTAGLTGETVHDAGIAGDIPLRLFELKKLVQRSVQDLLRSGRMQLPEALLIFRAEILVA